MKIIETYGNYIEKWSNEDPDRARWLLKTGWKAQNLKFRFAPDKRLMPADRYLARLMMDTMLMTFGKTTGKCNSQHLYSLRTVAGGRNPSV